jgi:hypothetical protein
MKQVYLLNKATNDGDIVLGVYSSEEKALAAKIKLGNSRKLWIDRYDVDEDSEDLQEELK